MFCCFLSSGRVALFGCVGRQCVLNVAVPYFLFHIIVIRPNNSKILYTFIFFRKSKPLLHNLRVTFNCHEAILAKEPRHPHEKLDLPIYLQVC